MHFTLQYPQTAQIHGKLEEASRQVTSRSPRHTLQDLLVGFCGVGEAWLSRCPRYVRLTALFYLFIHLQAVSLVRRSSESSGSASSVF